MAIREISTEQPGLKNTDPAALVQASPVDIEDVHIGIEHGPTGTVYNRMALPWSGGRYNRIGGSWEKTHGRDNALSGERMEENFPDITSRWGSFASDQQQISGQDFASFEELVQELSRVHGGRRTDGGVDMGNGPPDGGPFRSGR
jgi:hypothetical protein